ncbi:Zn-dependent hydrolase [Anaerobacillus sp. MEB173]|uniref:Zn-dependent hydrolase n=1 Tax=Anaerobacillus sp. MEB173 TaxID=3383345 RepID=UPI003F8E3346
MITKDFQLKPNTARIQNDIETLAKLVDLTKPGWTRRPFTRWYEESREWLKNEMTKYGLEVSIDSASNLIGRIPGKEEGLAPIMIGSHTDTVMGGGRFDGIIGVVAGLEIARRIKEENIQLRHPLEIVDFTAEEPSEFGISTIGSRGMVNNLTDDMLQRKDPSGLILKEGIRQMGGHPERIRQQARNEGDVALYLELHIEQGPVLEQNNKKLGVVTGIVGIQRYRVIVEGRPNHAGTTPMNMRLDALPGASELILALENICNETYSEQVVGTVGKLNVEPNGSNVIPGRVVFDLEIRSLETELMEQIMNRLIERGQSIESLRGLSISFDCLSKSEPIRVNSRVIDTVKKGCEQTAETITLPSGAGHDANQLAKIAPIGMIFVPSKDGRSHCPEEWTSYEDVALGVEALARSLILFDN